MGRVGAARGSGRFWALVEVLLLAGAMLFTAAGARAEERGTVVLPRTDPPAGWVQYGTVVSGYDSMLGYRYTRRVVVMVGPVEPVDGTLPPPPLEIRRATVGVHEIVSVPEGQKCDPEAPIYFEYGEELFGFGDCMP